MAKKIILAQIVDKLHVHQLLSKVANCKFAVRFLRTLNNFTFL